MAFYAEPIIAYRAWGVLPAETRLTPICNNVGQYDTWDQQLTGAWKQPGPQVAICTKVRDFPLHDDSTVPSDNCTCGFWGLKGFFTMLQELKAFNNGTRYGPIVPGCTCNMCMAQLNELPPFTFGLVALWGCVVEGEYGYRGQYARVHKLFPSTYDTAALAQRYDVPVVSPHSHVS